MQILANIRGYAQYQKEQMCLSSVRRTTIGLYIT